MAGHMVWDIAVRIPAHDGFTGETGVRYGARYGRGLISRIIFALEHIFQGTNPRSRAICASRSTPAHQPNVNEARDRSSEPQRVRAPSSAPCRCAATEHRGTLNTGSRPCAPSGRRDSPRYRGDSQRGPSRSARRVRRGRRSSPSLIDRRSSAATRARSPHPHPLASSVRRSRRCRSH